MTVQIPDSVAEYLKTLAFRSDPNLRPEGTIIEYDDNMILEYIKCSKDPIYFIETYCKVIHVDRGLVPFKLHDYQKRVVDAYQHNRNVVLLTARQMGKTTISAAFFAWYVLFNDEKTVAILANKAAVAREILSRIQTMLSNLPKWLQQGVVTWNKGSIELENRSRILSGATSSSGFRGFSINLLYLDEFGFVPNNIADEFFTSMFPTLSSGKETKLIISSTPNGYNHFHKIWSEAEKGINGFAHVRCDWWEHPDRDENWAEEQRQALGEIKYQQEVCVSFLGSSMTLLDGATLARLTYDVPLKDYGEGDYAGLKVYASPQDNHSYVMTVDVSRGRHLDYSAFTIFDVTEYPHRIACTFYNNTVAPLMYAGIIYQVAKQYNEAYLLIEINDIGAQVAEELYNAYEYENMFWTKAGDKLGEAGADPYPGIRTTKKTKTIGCANLKDIVEKNQLIINDYTMIKELAVFIQNRTGSYAADEGQHDDSVMTLVLFAWLCVQPWFCDLTDKSMRNKMYENLIHKMEEDLLVGGFSDGNEAYEDEPNWLM
jgi:hypothetical protein